MPGSSDTITYFYLCRIVRGTKGKIKMRVLDTAIMTLFK